ncbi:hypothetical protein HIM_10970 [Hirsutella minnesotensis 3608]|uniref:Uncharacterized protein n=1 Tax=Hirsutella minnesotensis 3608 TaxID=1043627 RepID=A0A0F7ZFS1_9HYPO|nr:hypothetical protein HIM_10970 [Hirsutella minnesotensis 3608]
MATDALSYRQVLSLLGYGNPSRAQTMLFTHDVAAFIKALRPAKERLSDAQASRDAFSQLARLFLDSHGRGRIYWPEGCSTLSYPRDRIQYGIH